MKPELGKYYRTRGGHKARVICLDAVGKMYPAVVLIEVNGCEYVYCMTTEGRAWLGEQQSQCDLISEWVDKPEWDWSKAADWHVAIAMDFDGRWFNYTDIPSKGVNSWNGLGVQIIPPEHAPKRTGDWRESLIIRPGFEKGESK